MVNLTNSQMKYISSIYHMVGSKLMNIAFPRPMPLERFEMDFVMVADTSEKVDEDIKGWSRIALALNRWREEKCRAFTDIEEKIAFTRLIFLSAGEKLEKGLEKEEEELLEYLTNPVGDD